MAHALVRQGWIMSDRLKDMLRRARRLSEKNAEIFEQGLSGNEEGPGGEVFEALRDVEAAVLASIEDARRGVTAGQGFSEAEGPDSGEVEEVAGMFAEIAERFSGHEAGEGDVAAAESAAEALQSAVEFYEQWLEEVEDAEEERFVASVLDAERAMHSLVADLLGFHEDPEGWTPGGEDPLLEEP